MACITKESVAATPSLPPRGQRSGSRRGPWRLPRGMGTTFRRECLSAFSDAGFDLTGSAPRRGRELPRLRRHLRRHGGEDAGRPAGRWCGRPVDGVRQPEPSAGPADQCRPTRPWPDVTAVHVGPIGLERALRNLSSFAHRSVLEADRPRRGVGRLVRGRAVRQSSHRSTHICRARTRSARPWRRTPWSLSRDRGARSVASSRSATGRRGSFVFDRRSGRSRPCPRSSQLLRVLTRPAPAIRVLRRLSSRHRAHRGSDLVAALLGTVAAAARLRRIGAAIDRFKLDASCPARTNPLALGSDRLNRIPRPLRRTHMTAPTLTEQETLRRGLDRG